MDSNNINEREEEEEKHNPIEEQQHTIVYAYNDNIKENPEETETILSTTNQTKPTTKRYKGVWRKNGRWVARIRDPITNTRVFLGKYATNEDALSAYYSKKEEFESQIRNVNVLDSVMIDKHGFLLGEFSRLDDDLKICE